MKGKTHVAMGIAVALTLSADQPIKNQIITIIASTFGSLIPDLDHPKAKINQKILHFKNKFYKVLFYLILSMGFVFLCFKTTNYIFGLLGVMFFFIGISTHRSFTHSIIGFLLAAYIIKATTYRYNLNAVYYGFIAGYISHLVADFFTVKGIGLFYPFKTRISSPIMIKTNGILENIIFLSLNLYSICLLMEFVKF